MTLHVFPTMNNYAPEVLDTLLHSAFLSTDTDSDCGLVLHTSHRDLLSSARYHGLKQKGLHVPDDDGLFKTKIGGIKWYRTV